MRVTAFFGYFILQIKQAGFYDNIIKTVRGEPEYFKVAFYGLGFPTFLRVGLKLFHTQRFASPLNNGNGAKNEEAAKQGVVQELFVSTSLRDRSLFM